MTLATPDHLRHRQFVLGFRLARGKSRRDLRRSSASGVCSRAASRSLFVHSRSYFVLGHLNTMHLTHATDLDSLLRLNFHLFSPQQFRQAA